MVWGILLLSTCNGYISSFSNLGLFW